MAAGGVGVYASSFAPAWFANFQYWDLPPDYQIEIAEKGDDPADSTVAAWQISEVFDWASLDGVNELSPAHSMALGWDTLVSEAGGITNISRIRALAPEANTVFARLDIESDMQRLLPLKFGYSDMARVYLNGQLLYEGSNVEEEQPVRQFRFQFFSFSFYSPCFFS